MLKLWTSNEELVPNCANNTKDGCIAMSKRIGTDCFAWADNRELIRRIDDMINYSGGYLVWT